METLTDSGVLVFLGVILACSILADIVANRTRIPRISLLVLLGVGIAVVRQLWLSEPPELLPQVRQPLIELALVMVAFLLGGEFTSERIRNLAGPATVFSLSVALVSALLVAVGLSVVGFPLVVSLALAAIAVATDPAGVVESIQGDAVHSESGRLLVAAVAVDDAWGVIFFGLSMALLGWTTEVGGNGAEILSTVWELGGAVVLGVAVGFPGAWLTGRLEPGEPTRAEAFALILLLAGLSSLLGVSELLASMVAGVIIVNRAEHHQRSFSEIERIKWPFLVFFFVLSGASLDLTALSSGLLLVSLYIGLRLSGRYLGGLLGARLIRSQRSVRGGLGLAMTPQAGVAIGMALLASERFPDHGTALMTVVVTSTVIFELIGPLLVRRIVT
ncbi:MAG: cation:proton antiporter [Pseudomonadota bacterium]